MVEGGKPPAVVTKGMGFSITISDGGKATSTGKIDLTIPGASGPLALSLDDLLTPHRLTSWSCENRFFQLFSPGSNLNATRRSDFAIEEPSILREEHGPRRLRASSLSVLRPHSIRLPETKAKSGPVLLPIRSLILGSDFVSGADANRVRQTPETAAPSTWLPT